MKKNDIVVIKINFDNYKFKTIESDEGLTIGCYENESQLLYIGLNIDYPNAKIFFSDNKIIIENLKIDLDLKLGIAINTKDNENDDSLWYGADPNYFSD